MRNSWNRECDGRVVCETVCIISYDLDEVCIIHHRLKGGGIKYALPVKVCERDCCAISV